MDKELCTFQKCVLDNLDNGVKGGLYRAEMDSTMITQFYFTLIFGAYKEEETEKSMEELLHMEMCILEYHTRAIATPKGLVILEEQLQNYQS